MVQGALTTQNGGFRPSQSIIRTERNRGNWKVLQYLHDGATADGEVCLPPSGCTNSEPFATSVHGNTRIPWPWVMVSSRG